MDNLAEMITTDQAAQIIGRSVRRVRQLADQLGGQRAGRDLLFPAARVREYARGPRPSVGYPKGRPRKPPADAPAARKRRAAG